MKRIECLLFFTVLLTGLSLQAQESVLLPNGSFERWTTHEGYDIQLFYSNIEVYDSFSTPNCWNYMSYAVNQSVSFFGMPININTSVPLIKASPDTVGVPDSSFALRMQTFMLDDIINPVVLTVASGMLDTMLTQSVIPSILSTGEINVEAILPLLSDLFSGPTDIDAMLSTLLAMDVNDYFTGGLALGDFRPSHLTGNYKYQSATAGDNGAVVMIGTRYNVISNRRDIVGVGLNMSLTDTNEYTLFEVEYMPLGDIMAEGSNLRPDSLIVLLLSSAGTNMQRGSCLSVDHLQMWPVPDTCATVLDLEVTYFDYDDPVDMVLRWRGSSQPDHWEIEYGLQGFQPGTGTTVMSDWNGFDIYSIEWNTLHYNTWYDFYVRSVCEDSIYGEWDSTHYLTHCAMVGSLSLIEEVMRSFT